MLTRRCLMLGFCSAILTPLPARAAGLNLDAAGLFIHGYDPVAYQRASGPLLGNAEFVVRRDGAAIRFASIENLVAFLAEPHRYMPAYGGFCSYGVRMGQKLDVDPLAFRVVDNRLFLQHDFGTQHVWMLDEGENIAVADRIWPQIADHTEGGT